MKKKPKLKLKAKKVVAKTPKKAAKKTTSKVTKTKLATKNTTSKTAARSKAPASKKKNATSRGAAKRPVKKKTTTKKPASSKAISKKTKWQILIDNQHQDFEVSKARIEELCLNVLKNFKVPAEYPLVQEMSILFINDQMMRGLNKAYRNKDKSTDVLSFSMLEGEAGHLSQSLGDVVISVDTARKQAKKHKYTLSQEISYLLIHGILHLLGYDHENVPKEEEKMMFAIQDHLFSVLGHSELC